MADKPSITLPKRAQDITGRRFGKLVALSYKGVQQNHSLWHFQCDCGNTAYVLATAVLSGKQVSCGCHKASLNRVHRTPLRANISEYHSYRNMLDRCYNEKYRNYHRYGGRGIAVCERWRNGVGQLSGFDCFLEDMGAKPSSGLQIDRVDGALGYSPENCRWATAREQQNNKENNRLLTVNGVTRRLADWAKDLGMTPQSLHNRLKRGMDPHIAVTKQKRKYKPA